MIKNVLFLLILILYSIAAQATGMYFIENKGQWDADVLFRTDVPGGFLFLKKKSFVYTFYDASKVADLHGKSVSGSVNASKAPELNSISAHGVEVKLVGALATTALKPHKPVHTRFSYFLGDRALAGDVQGYEEVVYENVYQGIDLRIYMHNAVLKYEYIVSPNARVGDIAMRYEGASDLSLNGDGQVIVKTPLSSFKENVPYSFQKLKDKTVEVKSKFSFKDGNLISFVLPEGYDKSQSLVIDPELIFSTYSGSLADNWGHTATYDNEGNLYSAGTVFGANFPATTGAFQIRFQGLVDVAVLKFNPDGSDLLYATYLGGSSTDIPNSLIVNSKKELLILGTTSSRNFPVTGSAFQKEFGGGSATVPISGLNLPNGSDIFIAKLSADGKQLLASTYLGGSGNDGLSLETGVKVKNYGDSFRGEIIVDKNDQIYAVTSTNSENFPLRNADKTTLTGRQDGVLFKLSSNLESLLWSTYVGGDGHDAVFSLKLTNNDDVYVAGITQSKDLKVHVSAYQNALKGVEDGFVARYSNQRLTNLTYLGTDKEDGAYLLDMDQTGNVYVYGTTYGAYPVSSGVYSNAGSGQFIHALDAGLSRTILSTVIGSGRGVPDISPTAFLVNDCGNIYIAGWGGDVNVVSSHNLESSTRGLPVTADAIQRQTSSNNFYIAILEEGAKSFLYGTFFGSLNTNAQGDHVDGGTSRFDKNGVIYHATCSCGGSNFPVTPQAWSRTNRNSNCNNAAFKIDIDYLKADFDVYEGDKKDVLKGCAPLTLSFENMSEGGVDYIWDVNGATISREEQGGDYVFRNAGEYTVTLRAYNRLSCKRMDIAQKKILVESINATVSRDTTVCENSTLRLTAAGGTSYKWTPTTDMVNPETANPSVTVVENTVYKVEISSAVGCKVEREVKVNVEKKNDFVAMPDVEVCAGETTTLTVNGEAGKYRWLAAAGFPETTGKTVQVSPTATTTYTIEGVYADGCRPLRQITVHVDKSFQPDFEIVKSGETCNEPFSYTLRNQGPESLQYEWNMGVGNVLADLHVDNFVYDTPGAYTVTLTAYNAVGCALSVTKQLQAEPPFILSNVITPNGDGKNDSFVVPITGSSLEIYNRWGKKIFTNPDYKNDWGKGVGNGTYFYVVDTPNGRHCKGWLEVVE